MRNEVSAHEAAESATYDHSKIQVTKNYVFVRIDRNRKRWKEGQAWGGMLNQGPRVTEGEGRHHLFPGEQMAPVVKVCCTQENGGLEL